ncbi:MAG: PD-(D/E)XK nuclease family protein [Bdellovibrionaceae bacterium]|nr:PD-(D/E)XK nuclease family protein [Pseudobdellovibrionaceae bacterium]
MLQLVAISAPDQVKEWLKDFDPEQQTWLVSDLRTKLHIQERLLDRYGFYPEDAVMRASDLWKTVLRRSFPELRVISQDYSLTLAAHFLENVLGDAGLGANAARSVMAYADFFAPILLHPEGENRLTEWMSLNPASQSWQDWFLHAKALHLWLRGQGLIRASWIPSLLLSETDLDKYFSRDFIVDLGAEMSLSEAELLQAIARQKKVTVFAPSPEWAAEFSHRLAPYEWLKGKAVKRQSIAPPSSPKRERSVLKYSGQLAECRAVVSKVRAWLDLGVNPKNISVSASDIEVYWPVLSMLLAEEGIPADKPIVTVLQSLTSVQRWLASLRLCISSPKTSDVEMSYYREGSLGQLSYSRFRALYANLYDKTDLNRDLEIGSHARKLPEFTEQMERDDFIMAALSLWPADEEVEPVLVLLKELLSNAVAKQKLSSKLWLSYLESISASKEKIIREANSSGISVNSLMSARSISCTHRIYIGLTEEDLRSGGYPLIPPAEIDAIFRDTGFILENPDQGFREFELRWQLETTGVEECLMTPMSAFDGSVLTPSAFWVKQSLRLEGRLKEVCAPQPIRLDFIQQAVTGLPDRPWSEFSREISERLEMDMGRRSEPLTPLLEAKSLNPHSFESYAECPFIFLAQKGFHLKSEAEVDLDLNPMSQGGLVHKALEKISQRAIGSSVSDAELFKLLEESKIDANTEVASEYFWKIESRRLVAMIRRFLLSEEDWRRKFTNVYTWGVEKSWTLWLDPNSGELSSIQKDGWIKVNGRVDRIEGLGQDYFLVLDYKNKRGSHLQAARKWLSLDSFQLYFYIQAVEKGAIADLSGQCLGAVYLFLSDRCRSVGLQILPEIEGKWETAKSSAMTKEEKENLFSQVSSQIAELSQKILRGEMAPSPKEESICEKCEWRKLCRAPHLH